MYVFCFEKKFLESPILDEPIEPTISLFSPIGPFSSLSLQNIKLPSEATMHLPIFFAPSYEEEVLEYIEIRAGKTICPLKISGRGVVPQLSINPEFLVFRLEAERESRTTLTLEVTPNFAKHHKILFVLISVV